MPASNISPPADVFNSSDNIHIPEKYGMVENKIRQSESSKIRKSPTVVLVKDAHCHYEAQSLYLKLHLLYV